MFTLATPRSTSSNFFPVTADSFYNMKAFPIAYIAIQVVKVVATANAHWPVVPPTSAQDIATSCCVALSMSE